MSDWTGFGPAESGEGIAAYEVDGLLASLTEKHLVVRNEATGRYRLLESVRAFGRAMLIDHGEPNAIRQLYRDYYLAFAEEAEPKLVGPEQAVWLNRLEVEHGNLRAAMDQVRDSHGDTELGMRLADALCRFWQVRGHYAEGRECLARLLTAQPAGLADTTRATALNDAASFAGYQGDLPGAHAMLAESFLIRKGLGDQSAIAASLTNLGSLAVQRGEYPVASAYLRESLGLYRELGDRRGIAGSLHALGVLEYHHGEYAAAQALWEESLLAVREFSDRWWVAQLLNNLGNVACDQGDHLGARILYQESLSLDRELGDERGIAGVIDGLASVMAALNDPILAARLWGAAERLRDEIGVLQSAADQSRYGPQVSAARATVGDEAFVAAWREGREMSLEQAIDYALAEPACIIRP